MTGIQKVISWLSFLEITNDPNENIQNKKVLLYVSALHQMTLFHTIVNSTKS